MFPGAGAQIYHNEAGEVTGWDYPPDSNDPFYAGDPGDDNPEIYDEE